MIRVVKPWPIDPVSAEPALPCHLHSHKNIIESEMIFRRSQSIKGDLACLCGTPPKATTRRVDRRLNNLDQASE